MDVKDFYLYNCMDQAEYIRIHISMIPKEFVIVYNLQEKVQNGYIFARVTNGMYGLPQEGQITNYTLLQHLAPYG